VFTLCNVCNVSKPESYVIKPPYSPPGGVCIGFLSHKRSIIADQAKQHSQEVWLLFLSYMYTAFIIFQDLIKLNSKYIKQFILSTTQSIHKSNFNSYGNFKKMFNFKKKKKKRDV